MNNFIKYIAVFLPLACLALFATKLQAQAFEGTITLTTQNPGMQEEAVVKWVTAGGNHKLVMNGTANGKSFSYSVLLLKNDNNVRILTDINGSKAMFVTPLNDVKPVTAPLDAAIVTTGEGSSTIAGYNCKKYTVESAEGSTSVFVTNQVSLNLSDLPVLLQKNGIFNTLAANNIAGLPLNIISRGADGKVLFSQTITSITPSKIAATEFSYEGYADGATIMQNSMKQD